MLRDPSSLEPATMSPLDPVPLSATQRPILGATDH